MVTKIHQFITMFLTYEPFIPLIQAELDATKHEQLVEVTKLLEHITKLDHEKEELMMMAGGADEKLALEAKISEKDAVIKGNV